MVSPVAPNSSCILEDVRAAGLALANDLEELVHDFLAEPITPESTCEFETRLQQRLQAAGRQMVEAVYNQLEPDEPRQMPQQVERDGQDYSRKHQKTLNRGGVGTLFGRIGLSRVSYEPLREARDDRQPSFSPLEVSLGLVAGSATPALAERVGREAASQTQGELREWLQREHRVSWSVEVLRRVTQAVSAGVKEQRHEAQQEQLLKWLKQAEMSRGRQKITLAVGRDGLMLPLRDEPTYKEGAVATVSVLDRRGNRLGTVYLGQMPEAYQTTLSAQLTQLVRDVLGEWNGPWPRLAYITDAGYHPTDYFENTLSQLEHPRQPGRCLEWTRLIDYYHVCQHVSKLAAALFGQRRQAEAWSRKMRKWLKHRPNAVFRILHSAAKHRFETCLTRQEERAYQEAYHFLLKHKALMDYQQARRVKLPIGSGMTEAACKTVFTQRFKESGMSWKREGGQAILALRVAKLSGVWETAFARFLASQPLVRVPTKQPPALPKTAKAA